MNSIHDITDYIILRVKSEDRFASLINLKLQKLLYYVQAWSYGIEHNIQPAKKTNYQIQPTTKGLLL